MGLFLCCFIVQTVSFIKLPFIQRCFMALCLHVSALIFYVLISTFFFFFLTFQCFDQCLYSIKSMSSSYHALAWPMRKVWPSWPLPLLGSRTQHCPDFLHLTGFSSSVSTAGQGSFVPPPPVAEPQGSLCRSLLFPMDTYNLPDHILCNGLEIASTFNFLGLTSV